MNVFTFTGNLGQDAILRFTKDNTPVLGFSVGASAGYGERKETVWVDCSLFGNLAEAIAPYMKIGTKVCASGEISLETFTKKDGEKATKLKCKTNSVTLMGSKSEETKSEPETRYPEAETADDTIPF